MNTLVINDGSLLRTLSNDEQIECAGGFLPLAAVALGVTSYMALLNKMENYPDSYTWMMDWYY